jgi:enoyl-CoA hydratase/carnithine racemase
VAPVILYWRLHPFYFQGPKGLKVIEMAKPPVNSLSLEMIQSVTAAFKEAEVGGSQRTYIAAKRRLSFVR